MQSTSVSDPKAHLKSPKAPRSPKPPLSPNVRSTTQEQPDNLSLTDELDLPGPSPSLGSSETRRKRGSTLPGRLKRADGMMGSGSFSSSFLGSIFRGFIGQSSSSQGKCEEASSSPSVVKDLQKNLNLGGATTPNVLQRPYRDVGARYKLGKAIGSGTYGTVYLCTDNMTKEKLACKSVDKSRLKSIQDIMAVRAEVKALETVGGHPSVVSLKGVYEDLKSVHLVMELCEGGELFEKVRFGKPLPEASVALICKQLVSVLEYCHSLGVVHRDIKPENVMLSSKSSLTDVRLVDFGHAGFIKEDSNMREMVGTAMYVAPEVLRQNYGSQADLWSLGICLYVLLTGVLPFDSDEDDQIFKMVANGKVQFSEEKWRNISPEAKHLVAKLLVKDPTRRITAEGVEGHPWILKHCGKVMDPVRIPVFELKPAGDRTLP